jgi:hypothetical protein
MSRLVAPACLAFSGLMLAACTPEAKPPEPAVAPAAASPTPEAPVLAADEIPAPAGEITVSSPVSGATVTSPLSVEGAVINNWMFEGVIPVELAIDGEVISQAPGQQQAPDNWTNPGPVRFKAVLTFDVTEPKNAVLILREDSPKPQSPDSDVAGPARTLRIPLVLAPAPK